MIGSSQVCSLHLKSRQSTVAVVVGAVEVVEVVGTAVIGGLVVVVVVVLVVMAGKVIVVVVVVVLVEVESGAAKATTD